MGAQILIADDDTTTCKILSTILQKGGYSTEVVHRGSDALARLSAQDAPAMALLDWLMPDMSGLEVCRGLRAHPGGAAPYIFLVSSRQSPQDMLQGFDAGVDEFIAKPFDPQLVLARLQAAERRVQAEEARGVRGVWNLLHEASKGSTGEVIVRSQESVGRVVFYLGKVAWIHLSRGASLLPLLTGLGLPESAALELLDECRHKRLPLLDTVASRRSIPREQMRSQILHELATRLGLLLALPSTTSFFVPGNAPLASRFTYELSELEPWPLEHPSALHSLPEHEPHQARPVPDALARQMEAVARINGVESVVLVSSPSGEIALSLGAPCNEGFLHKMTRLFLAETSQTAEESLLVGSSAYHILRGLPDSWLAYARVDRHQNPNIGQVRFELSPPRA